MTPGDLIAAHEARRDYRGGLGFPPHQNERVKQFVPGEDKTENGGDGDTWCAEGKSDPPKDTERIVAFQGGSLVQLFGNPTKLVGADPNYDWHIERQVDENQDNWIADQMKVAR